MLRPGELLVVQLRPADGPWLQPGDVVELELEGIGVLRNTRRTPRVAAKYPLRRMFTAEGAALASPACRHSEIRP